MSPLRRLVLLTLCVLPPWMLCAQVPYRLDWHRDCWILAGGSALSAVMLAGRGAKSGLTSDEIARLSVHSINGFDRGATRNSSMGADRASDWLVYGLIASPALLLAGDHVRDEWQTVAVMYAETMLLTLAAVEVLKNRVDRIRPIAYHAGVPRGENLGSDVKRSFPSSHTAFAFSSALFLSTVHAGYEPDSRCSPYLWAGTLLAASAVGTLRYAAGAHFPTDILAGAALGGGIGLLVPLLHRPENDWVGVGVFRFGDGSGIRVMVKL